MKCKQCIAWDGKTCKAGVVPYKQRRSGEMGCCCNTQQVAKYVKEELKKA